ncbi:hypothetical protein ACS18Q_17510 [Vibrio sp. Vf1514]|jgi:hypothetical protein|uniref:hypothetical protein n=1 Tax=Gammaproteobacteria TaxID=1236 RepID=UPI0025802548|nr:hypothetical protein [Shewanella sp.]
MNSDQDLEPQEDAPSAGGDESGSLKGSKRRSFTKLRRELEEEELNSPAVQKLLIDEIERLERENIDLVNYQDKYYQVDKAKAVLDQKLKTSISQEIISGVCMTVGAASLGYAPTLWAHQPSGWIAIIFGGVLIVGGIIAKAVKS